MSKLFKEIEEIGVYDLIWLKGEGQKTYRVMNINALREDKNTLFVEEWGSNTHNQKLINRSDIEKHVGVWC